jgi:hypothetical protein
LSLRERVGHGWHLLVCTERNHRTERIITMSIFVPQFRQYLRPPGKISPGGSP